MTVTLSTEHWHYLHGCPSATGTLKAAPEDFQVEEILGFSPSGEGEHVFLWTEKRGLNTAYVAEQLAAYLNLPLRAVTYAGRKDKHALTRQWFGLHMPGQEMPDLSGLNVPGFRVLSQHRHNKKLRTGVLKGNQFTLQVRDIDDRTAVEHRLRAIADSGVPNYYGQQRFGDSRHHANGGNLNLGERLIAGEAIRNRNKRNLAISALRSWLFNQVVSCRLARQDQPAPLAGDVFLLAGSNSFFVAQGVDAQILQRLEQRDILLSAPLWGKGPLASQHGALALEQAALADHQPVCAFLASLGLDQERRTLMLYPKELQWHWPDDKTLSITFSLPSGCFATAVIREVCQLTKQEDKHEAIAE
ncbi:tRNA pseudouridine(13) synthase TruD [Aestuariibacter halophilus]|uniref:tRNA pseudouridine synthase D n=1 Tax=Fluctibacter halophilus TaxID=226011 RepID=A0ABS8GCK3_9ALTE|nr:tRNA pseudouridine(13) synthase TruD [Aestuariibacter halophilus]MCC2617981.1 tRNA pseudouridine(13) synthase TruD [Aestuariibacter halophilus]